MLTESITMNDFTRKVKSKVKRTIFDVMITNTKKITQTRWGFNRIKSQTYPFKWEKTGVNNKMKKETAKWNWKKILRTNETIKVQGSKTGSMANSDGRKQDR